MEKLWETHPGLQTLQRDGARKRGNFFRGTGGPPRGDRDMAQKFPDQYEDLLTYFRIGGCEYLPLVRSNLHLCCELDVLFLRQQDPGALISQGGDLDNRIKTLLDALRMPSKDEQDRSGQPDGSKLYCLMESDTLVSRLDVDTDRLLFPASDKPHEVHLVIKVSLNVLKVAMYNVCLL
jgi:hypothetical protein